MRDGRGRLESLAPGRYGAAVPRTGESTQAQPPSGLSRRELEREAAEHLPDREGTLDRLSERATAERASRTQQASEEERVND